MIPEYKSDLKGRAREYDKKRYLRWLYANNKEYKAHKMSNTYYSTDQRKGFTNGKLDERFIIENILNKKCVYCGEQDWKKLGCDRIDNTKGHTEDNVVCCCGKCNSIKSDKNTLDFLISKVDDLLKENRILKQLIKENK